LASLILYFLIDVQRGRRNDSRKLFGEAVFSSILLLVVPVQRSKYASEESASLLWVGAGWEVVLRQRSEVSRGGKRRGKNKSKSEEKRGLLTYNERKRIFSPALRGAGRHGQSPISTDVFRKAKRSP
jgi:hypothetical protein